MASNLFVLSAFLVLACLSQFCVGEHESGLSGFIKSTIAKYRPLLVNWFDVSEETEQEKLIVRTKYGDVLGTKLKDLNNRDFYAFRGIPYAKAPIGDLRFRNATHPTKWDGVLDATNYRNNCLQTDFKGNVLGSEDCLYVNVFTPTLPGDSSYRKPMAVIVYIHGGMWLFGSGDREGPKRLMGHDVVLVTFNYRLGAFGFLSTEDEEVRGNFGFKDQVEALRWVRINIAHFGGNPFRTTIFGHDAGAASVIGHIASPMSADLFDAAISASGTLYWDRDIEKHPLNNTKLLAEKVGCSTSSTISMVNCLRATPAEKIIIATDDIRKSGSMNTTIPFRPTIDGKFLTDYPEKVFGSGVYNHVPLMTGVTRDEGVFYYLMIANAPKLAKTVEEAFNTTEFEELLPFLAIELYKSAIGQIPSLNTTERIKRIYFGRNYSRALTLDEKIDGILNATGDLVQNSILDFTSRMFANDDERVYTYRISLAGPEPTLWKLLPGAQFVPQTKSVVSVGDELQFLFTHNDTCKFNADEDRMAEIMVNLWTTFARTGVPELPRDGFNTNVWKPTYEDSENSPNVLDINPRPYMFKYLGNSETFRMLEAYYYFSIDARF